MLLAQALARNAREIGDRVAYVAADGWTTTYRELDKLSDEVAVALARRHGVREGDVVGLVTPSNVDYVVAYAALTKLGACTAGVNPLLTARERAAAFDAAQPRFVIATAELTEGLPAAAEVLVTTMADHAGGIFADLRAGARDEAPPALAPDPNRMTAICFMSGSSGLPKGVLFRERQIDAIAEMDMGSGGGWGAGVHSIAATQHAHVGGMTKIPWMLASGSTIHLLAKWRAAQVLELTEKYRLTTVNAGPTQVALMLRLPDFDRYDLSSVKLVVVGMGPSSPALIMEARERFHAGYSVRYSSTESGGIGTGTAPDAPDEEAFYTIGRPRPGVEAKVADDDGRELPAGEIGELWLRSPAVMSEYYVNPDETARTLVGGRGATATSATLGCSDRTFSTSSGYTL